MDRTPPGPGGPSHVEWAPPYPAVARVIPARLVAVRQGEGSAMENQRMPNAHGVVAVYKDEASAQRAATALRSMGVAESAIRSGGARDGSDASSVEPIVQGHSTVIDAEGALFAGAFGTAAAMGIGAIIGFPFGFIEFLGWPFWLRAISTAIVGALTVGAIALIAAPALLSTRAPDQAREGVKGVVLEVDDYSAQIAAVITNEKPVRVDLIGEEGETLPGEVTGH